MRIPEIDAEITLVRSARKTLSAQIAKDGSIEVRAPLRLPEREVIRFLTEKAGRIGALLEKHRQQAAALAEAPPLTPEMLEALAEQALKVIPERVRHYAKCLGVSYGRITIRCQKTRWGSCAANGNLSFNCLLMLTPPEVLDSVVVHELCHRLEMNHSPAFYAHVYRVFPEYDRCRRWLNAHGSMLLRRP